MIFVTGDLHGEFDIHKLNTTNFLIQSELTKNDYLIICGDFGLVWGDKNDKTDLYWQRWLNGKPFTTLFIDGNHENHDLLQQYPVTEWNGGKVHQIQPTIFHLMRGQIFEIENKTFFTMGGAPSNDKAFRKEGVSWWSEELPSQEEYAEAERNLARYNWKVDYVVTHCAPTSMHRYIDSSFTPDELTNFLEGLSEHMKWTSWFVGHYHLDKSLGRYRLLYDDILEIIK